MTDLLELISAFIEAIIALELGTAVMGAIIVLAARELFTWKFVELERQKKHNEKLLEKVYGPIHVLTKYLAELEDNKLLPFKEEHYSVKQIFSLYDYEFDSEYRKLLDHYIRYGDKRLSVVSPQTSAEGKDKVIEFIRITEKIHADLVANLKYLSKMRSGFFRNLWFLFGKWRFKSVT